MNTKIYKQCIDILEEGGFYENAKSKFKGTPTSKTIGAGFKTTAQELNKKEYDEYCLTQTNLFYNQVTEFLNSSKG